ncbi:hypothetical protein FHR81_001174 [Actinoalloteichus hoggarensis]|uniref:Uncharacterized protein n=1 Tax=Actinoalloteichus hoggarensis TaxID=1470176 RepID=A0A221VZG3_9PSEU|nr:hypothetical protein [Actinoalloteichus hoggarensis]ASO18909.1 hypothetical protein AHOG_06285 [Actinoalloteichus hoggarensis]MBB5920144.1 hypothetical protein [Actinoalloteichus hoggarensis]
MQGDISMLAGFFEGPLFHFDEDGDWMNHSPTQAGEDLRLSTELVADLAAWDDEYQATYDDDYPPDSRFPSPEARAAWVERGKELAARIKQESPFVTSVDYQANGSYKNGECVI